MAIEYDIFYDTQTLTSQQKRGVLLTGLSYNDEILIEVRDDNELCRVSTKDLTFGDFYNDLSSRDEFKIIFRRGMYDPYVGLIGVCRRLNDKEYFLWIYIKEKEFNKYIVDKYKLKVL